MTKEDKQIIDRAVKEEWRIGDRTHLKRLLEKNLKQYREKVELENKIADIKANCDFAIEGRDIKIKELEKENAELKSEKGCETCTKFDEVKLTKAKELLELFIQWNYGCCKIPDLKDIVKQAEQFIKEIEK